jgi:hypothetical protein
LKTYLKYNNIIVECFPKNALKLSHKKNTDEVFLRRDLTESLIFVDDDANGHFDFSNIINQVLCTEFTFYIPEKEFSASFFITECEIDEYRRTLTVKPIVIDEYTPIDNVIGEKINLSAKDIGETQIKLGNISYNVTNWWFTLDNDTIFQDWEHMDIDTDGSSNHFYEPKFNEDRPWFPPIGTLTRLYRYTVTVKSLSPYWDESHNLHYDAHCKIILNYRTEIVCTGEVLSSGDGWQIKEDISDEFKIYHRRYGGNIDQTYAEIPSTHISNPSISEPGGWLQPAPGYDFVEQASFVMDNYNPNPEQYNQEVGSYPFLTFLKSYYLGNLEIESQFFNDEINPIAVLLGLTFSTKYLYVSIFSNFALEIAGLPVERRATKTEITLKEIFDFLYSLFRVRWDIHNGKLRLEHEYFYENHYSYGSVNPLIKNINNYNNYIYSFSSPDINKGRKLSYNDSRTEEFSEHALTFKSGNTLCVHQLKDYDSESISIFCNDINYVLYNWDEIRGATGLIMLHSDSNNEIISSISEYDNSTIIPNGFLSILNSLRYFHSMLGYFTNAVLESKDVNGTRTFDINIKRLKRVKLQKDVMINSSDFKTDYTYITPIGQGVVEEAEEDLNNGTVNLTLLYD